MKLCYRDSFIYCHYIWFRENLFCILIKDCKFNRYKLLNNEVILFFNRIRNDSVLFCFTLAHPKHEPN